MICKRHNKFVRIGNCPDCIKESDELRFLEYEIKELEKEIKEPIVIYSRF